MDCNEIQSAIFDAVDAGEALSGEIERHLADCQACRQHYDRLVRLCQALACDLPPATDMPDGFAPRVMLAIEAEKRRRKTGRRRLVLSGTIAAAAACLLVGAAWMMLPAGRDPVDGNAASIAMTAPIELGKPILAEVRLLGDPIADEMNNFVDDTRRLGRSLLAQLPVDLLPGVGSDWAKGVLPDIEAGDRPATTTGPHTTDRG